MFAYQHNLFFRKIGVGTLELSIYKLLYIEAEGT